MKVFVVALFLVVGFIKQTKADTIDFWHVYYNNVEIKDYTDYGSISILTLKLDSIKLTDRITVKFFNDRPCFDCKSFLAIEGLKKKKIILAKGRGTGNPVTFTIKRLLSYKKRFRKNSFGIFYFESKYGKRVNSPPLFTIQLE